MSAPVASAVMEAHSSEFSSLPSSTSKMMDAPPASIPSARLSTRLRRLSQEVLIGSLNVRTCPCVKFAAFYTCVHGCVCIPPNGDIEIVYIQDLSADYCD